MEDTKTIEDLENGIEIGKFTKISIGDDFIAGAKKSQVYIFDKITTEKVAELSLLYPVEELKITENYLIILDVQKLAHLYDKTLALKFKIDTNIIHGYSHQYRIYETNGMIIILSHSLVIFDINTQRFTGFKFSHTRDSLYTNFGNSQFIISREYIQKLPMQLFNKDVVIHSNSKRLHSVDVNESVIVTGGEEGVLHILHRYTQEVILQQNMQTSILVVRLLDTKLAVGLASGDLAVVDLDSLQITYETITDDIGLSSITEINAQLLIGDTSGKLHIIDVSNLEKLNVYKLHSDAILDIKNDDFYIYIGSVDGRTSILDINSYDRIAKLKQNSAVLGISVIDDYIFTAGANNAIIKWNKSSFQENTRSESYGNWITAIEDDGKYIYTTSHDGLLRIFDTDCKLLSVTQIHSGYIDDLAIHIDKILITTDDEGLLSTSKLVIKPNVEKIDYPIELIPYSTVMDNRYYFYESDKQQVVEWDLQTNSSRIIYNNFAKLKSAKLSSGNGYLLINSDGFNILIDIKTNEKFRINSSSTFEIKDNHLIEYRKDSYGIYPLDKSILS